MIKTFQKLLEENKVKNIGDKIYYNLYDESLKTQCTITGVNLCCIKEFGEKHYYIEYTTSVRGWGDIVIIDCLEDYYISEYLFSKNVYFINKGEKNDG